MLKKHSRRHRMWNFRILLKPAISQSDRFSLSSGVVSESAPIIFYLIRRPDLHHTLIYYKTFINVLILKIRVCIDISNARTNCIVRSIVHWSTLNFGDHLWIGQYCTYYWLYNQFCNAINTTFCKESCMNSQDSRFYIYEGSSKRC